MLKDFFVNLNEYEKKERIGIGGYGQVFLIRKKTKEELYAAKIFQGNPFGEKSFMTEIETYCKIKHQAILPFIGYSLKDFESYHKPTIITEYMCNGSLRDIFDQIHEGQSQIEWTDTKRYIALLGIALGMNHLHSKGIVHRDLKPENILFDCDYYPKICDFGISKITNEDINDLLMKTSIGTPRYRAPETYEGTEYNFKADIYSFSIVLYEIIVAPFKSSQKVEITDIKGEDNRDFFKRCNSKDPDERPDFSEICYFMVTKSFIELFENIELNEVVTFLDLFKDDVYASKMKQIYLSEVTDEIPVKKFEQSDEISKSKSDSGFIEIDHSSENFQDEMSNKEAARNLKKSADSGNSTAMYNYAKMLLKGNGVKKDMEEAARYFKQSADSGNSSAMYSYAKMLLKGDGIKMDKKEAAHYFKKSADLRNDRAMNMYGTMLRRGEGIPMDKDEATCYYHMAIELGNSTAMNNYALMLRDGDGIPQDKKEAARYFRKSIDHGGDYAMYYLAQMLKDGDGIPQDKKEAFRYFKIQAEKGNSFAMNSYAMMLRDGDCFHSDKVEASRYFKLAADKGNDRAIFNYAKMLKEGDGIQMNKSEAFRYFKMASVRGSDRAMNTCAEMLRDGDGVPANKEEAAKLFKKAADNGNDHAMVNYANMLLNGDGIPMNKKEAEHYFELAALKRNTFALKKLPRLRI